jgi:hypothetical protein
VELTSNLATRGVADNRGMGNRLVLKHVHIGNDTIALTTKGS